MDDPTVMGRPSFLESAWFEEG